ncbi:MAG: IS701 family transposase [Opitutaceae bacterium]|nr:IS701 family transposase [Opitutaceae bacterium]
MTPHEVAALDRRLDHFLADLTESLGRSERHRWAKVYLQGLLMDGERKSIEPLAERIAGADVQALRQFVGQSPWAVELIQQRLAEKVADLLSEPEVWMIDETSFPKAGEASVGVARQYCGALGKIANCQVAVSLHWSTCEASCPVAWRLYLPQSWLASPARRAEGKIPDGISYRSKNQLSLELLDQAMLWEVPRLPVVADSAYGNDFDFRAALRERGLQYAVAVEPSTKVWTTDPALVSVPANKRGRPRKYPALTDLPAAKTLTEVATELPKAAWRNITWRQGAKGPLRSRFAQVKVWAAHGWKRQEHPKRVMEWLLIEWPENAAAPTDHWLAQLGEQSLGLRRLVKTARARWRVELDYRELKEELGLDHYEGRHWLGWHHHVTLVSLAFAFLRTEQAKAKKNCWCDVDNAAPHPSAAAAAADSSDRTVPVV